MSIFNLPFSAEQSGVAGRCARCDAEPSGRVNAGAIFVNYSLTKARFMTFSSQSRGLLFSGYPVVDNMLFNAILPAHSCTAAFRKQGDAR